MQQLARWEVLLWLALLAYGTLLEAGALLALGALPACAIERFDLSRIFAVSARMTLATT